MSSTIASTGASIDTVIGRSFAARPLQRLELAGEQARRHEVPLARGEPGGDQILRSVEKDDADIVAAVHENVAIGALQRRAGDDGAFTGGREAVDLVGNRLQPRPAVLVRQRMAGAHLRDVACRVKPVAILVAPAESSSEMIGDGALARAGNAHHHQRARGLTAHQNSPESRLGPPARPSRRWTARGWRAGSRLRRGASRSHAYPCLQPRTAFRGRRRGWAA